MGTPLKKFPVLELGTVTRPGHQVRAHLLLESSASALPCGSQMHTDGGNMEVRFDILTYDFCFL